MKSFKRYLIFYLLLIGLTPPMGQACTTFSLVHQGQQVFGKNYDWHLERALVMVNKRGVLKTAIDLEEGHGPYVRWKATYGSVTFNQYGREIPSGGMNEAGLVIHIMMLMESEYPSPDARPGVACGQWVQYQLDNFSTVKEVIASDTKQRILPVEGHGVHYLVADKSGDCAAIEFLDGKLVCHTQEAMPTKALANSTYADSLTYLQTHTGFGGQNVLPEGQNSLARFVRTANMLQSYSLKGEKPIVDYAFDILANVAQTSTYGGTKWSIVYDVQTLRVYFRTFSNQRIRFIDLQGLDFSCATPVKILNINIWHAGDVTQKFNNYTLQENLGLIRYAFKGTYFLRSVADDVLEQLAGYPEETTCIGISQR